MKRIAFKARQSVAMPRLESLSGTIGTDVALCEVKDNNTFYKTYKNYGKLQRIGLGEHS